jgi:N utilization substance protein A
MLHIGFAVRGEIRHLLIPELEVEVAAPGVPEEEETTSFDELFKLRPDVLEMVGPLDEDEEEGDRSITKKKKKKKKKYVEVEYDPDKDVLVARKKRKRGGTGEWSDDRNL